SNLSRPLYELDERAVRIAQVDHDGAFPGDRTGDRGRLAQGLVPGRRQAPQSLGEVMHPERDVRAPHAIRLLSDAARTALDVFDQLNDPAVAGVQIRGPDPGAVDPDDFTDVLFRTDLDDPQAKQVAVEGQRPVQVAHRDAGVVDAGHHRLA